MNIKKIVVIALFLLVLVNVTIGASYATSNEKITLSHTKQTGTFNKEIAFIEEIGIWDKEYNIKYSYKVNIKKINQNKYKIKSVRCKYDVYNSTTDKYSTIFKTYNGKNKKSLNIKPSKNYKLESMTINYQTKSKINKESLNLWSYNGELIKEKYVLKGIGKKSGITVTEKGYYHNIGHEIPTITYIKFNIKTTNKKYKIKTVKLIYRDMEDKISKTTTFNGNRKTSLTKTVKGEFVSVEKALTEFKVTYY